MQQIGDKDFDKKVKIKGPVVLYFHADWAGPCRMIEPELAEVVENYPDLTLYGVNIEEQANTAVDLGVKGVPALLLMQDGVLVASKVGALPAQAITDWLIEGGAI